MTIRIGILSMLCCNLLLFSCQKQNVTSGNLIDKTDIHAPKEIVSNEITYFYVDFYHIRCVTQNYTHQFTFEVVANDQNQLIAYEKNTNSHFIADETLLTNLQMVILEQKLVEYNGIYRIRSGLDPKYQKCELHVTYSTNEKLDFTLNNDPYAIWTEQIYTVFKEWFLAKGIIL